MMIAASSGVAIGGTLGWKHAQKDETLDKSDRVSFASTSALLGGVTGLAVRHAGLNSVSNGLIGSVKTANTASKILAYNPIKDVSMKLGRKTFGLKSLSKVQGPMKLLAFVAGSVGLIAYGSRTPSHTEAYASPDGLGGTDYNKSTTSDRMNRLNATGDMIFGLHNSRHG